MADWDLLDTPLLVDWLRGNPQAIAFLRRYRHRRRGVCASVITRAEVLLGMRPEEMWRTHRFLHRFRWIEITTEIADKAAEYMRLYGKTHGLTLADALIAATAWHLGARLVTLDRDFFPMRDVRVFVPY